MKNSFKPMALAAAVAGLSAGTVGVVNAQPSAAGIYPSLGGAAFVPYYTVQEDWVTGVHIINTSELTQVVKFRMRRAEDSEDVFDFNIILSPFDVWTGTVRGDDTAMEVFSEDQSCTAPVFPAGGVAPLREANLDGAQEGYIEVIGMGAADADQPISKAAVHVDGTPLNCNRVRDNFFPDAVVNFDTTVAQNGTSTYLPTDDVLKVSYFIRDNASGIEFGNNAVHFTGYASESMMTHQKFGLESFGTEGDDALKGWDFPDVRGGSILNVQNGAGNSSYPDVVRVQLGAEEIKNDWSYNPATGAATDWVINFPGQYAHLDIYQETLPGSTFDYREIPTIATFSLYDREEGEGVPGGLDFSPSPAPDAAELPYEVNVVTWGSGPDVLNSEFALNVDPASAGIDSPVGWASLSVEATAKRVGGSVTGAVVPWAWCDAAAGPDGTAGDFHIDDQGAEQSGGIAGACDLYEVDAPVPMMGFAAWERTFSEDADRNYGRIVEHSFTSSSAP